MTAEALQLCIHITLNIIKSLTSNRNDLCSDYFTFRMNTPWYYLFCPFLSTFWWHGVDVLIQMAKFVWSIGHVNIFFLSPLNTPFDSRRACAVLISLPKYLHCPISVTICYHVMFEVTIDLRIVYIKLLRLLVLIPV